MSGSTDPASPIAFVAADERDHEEIVALANRACRGAGGWNAETGLIEGERTTLARLREDLAGHPKARLLIHRDPETSRLVACVRLEPRDGQSWHLGLLAVDPDLQARGLGRRALTGAEEAIRAGGGTRVEMSVINLRADLIAWYERRGYVRTGEIEPFPYGDERLGRPLRGDLAFILFEKAL